MIQLDADDLLESRRDWQTLLDGLSNTDARICLVVTGGGTGAIGRCFGRSGASQNFVEAAVPYSRQSLDDFLGHRLDSPSVCELTVAEMAGRAMERARRLTDHSGDAMGIALTASLPTHPPRDHEHAIFAAFQTESLQRSWCVKLMGDRWDRVTAEQIAEATVYNALLDCLSG